MLKAVFAELVKKYSDDEHLASSLWTELEEQYANKKRHYHTLSHLENLLQQLTAIKTQISDWDVILFSLFYHDAVYNASKSNNEEKSAELAQKRMKQLNVPAEKINRCTAQILATKAHAQSDDADTNLFTDADLSILGASADAYIAYYKQIRKEYSVYPDFMYKPGRKKVLQHFLNMNRIFKTDHFFEKLEKQARQNLKNELESNEK